MPSYVLKRRKQVLAPNITTVGNPTIVDNVASGFVTGTSYLTYPEVVDVNGNWEAILKLRTEVTPPDSSILSFPNNNNFGCQLNVSGGKFLFVWNHIPGNRWDIYDTGVVIPVNKDVWVKYTKAGAIFKLYTSDDGLTYTEVASREYTATLYTPNTGFNLGGAVNNQVAWNGSIDLNESYIKINDELWWSGTHYIPDDKSYILKRKPYMKYVYNYWQQPVLTANGTMGGDSFAVNQSSYYTSDRQAWRAFNGVDNDLADWNSAQGVPQWISWYNPVPLSISKITVVNTFDTPYPDTIKDYEVQVSDDNSTWTTIYSGTNTTGAGETWSIDLSSIENNSKYWRIYITSCNNRNYARITELKITAQEVIAVSGTPSDYDFVGDAKSYALRNIKE